MSSHRRYINPELQQATALSASQQQSPVSGPVQMGAAPPPHGQSVPSVAPTANIIFPWGNAKLLNPESMSGDQPLPPYFRSTVSYFPSSKSVQEMTKVPLALIVNPSQVNEVPLVDYSNRQVPRCQRCLSYLSPYSEMVAGGNSWKCPFCNAVNQLENLGYGAADRTIEFVSPVYDIKAPDTFKGNSNICPSFVFLIDMSMDAITSGFTPSFLSSVKASLPSLDQQAKISIITMGNHLSVYDFARHTQFIIADIAEPFIPSSPLAPLSECLEEAQSVIDDILNNIGQLASPGHCFGSALLLAGKVMAKTGGVLLASCCGIPTVGPYKLNPRTSDKEITLIHLPEDGSGKFYREIGFQLNRIGVSVILFALNNGRSCDIPLISVPCGLTGGNCFHYSAMDPGQLHNDIFSSLTSSYLWNSSMRLRCTSGIKISFIYSNCSIRESTVSYPIMSAHNAITFEVSLETEINSPVVHFQAAVLWLNSESQPMIRVFTFSLPTTNKPQIIKSSLDEAALATYLAKKAAVKVLQSGPEEATLETKRILASICSGGFRYSSLYHLIHSLLCSHLLRLGIPGGVDTRVTNVLKIRASSIPNTLLYMYPRFYALDAMSAELPLEQASFSAGSIFLVHTVSKIYVWVSPSATPEALSNLFGISSIDQLPQVQDIPQLNNELNTFAQNLLQNCYLFSGKYLPTEIIPPGGQREAVFADILVDMSTACGSTVSSFITEMSSSL